MNNLLANLIGSIIIYGFLCIVGLGVVILIRWLMGLPIDL